MRREKAEPLLEGVALCAQMGWTYRELMEQPAGFVDRLEIYLGALGDRQAREQRGLEEELDRLRRRR